MIGVVDYRAGNAPSVLAALKEIGEQAQPVSEPEALASVDRVILPGVGSWDATLSSLSHLGLMEALTDAVIRGGKPFLGVCIGLQILFESSEEGSLPGLRWLKGRARKFNVNSVRVPQIGWNAVSFDQEALLTNGIPDNSHYYFVNSFYIPPDVIERPLGVSVYDVPFTAALSVRNIVATQFHIEKSGPLGLHLLRNFCTRLSNAN